jgi:hypothetical protein
MAILAVYLYEGIVDQPLLDLLLSLLHLRSSVLRSSHTNETVQQVYFSFIYFLVFLLKFLSVSWWKIPGELKKKPTLSATNSALQVH